MVAYMSLHVEQPVLLKIGTMIFMFKWNPSLVADNGPLLWGTGHQLKDTFQVRLIKTGKHF